MRKILFLTPMRISPLHIRVEIIRDILYKNGFDVEIVNLSKRSKINIISMGFFDVYAFFRAFKYIKNFQGDIVYLTDLKYLPLAIIAKLFGKKVIYETLDNNVELHFFAATKKIKFLKYLQFIKKVFSNIERYISKIFADEVIVNSKALNEYFFPIKTNLIFYSSPFEDMFKIDYNKKEIAFIYLGVFNINKGAEEIIEFIKKYKIKTFIFGEIMEKKIESEIRCLQKKGLVYYKDRLSLNDLTFELEKVFKNYRPVGFSLIKSVNYSYETQEANKDIDYMAMGIPFIGNFRLPTKKKIDSGCGVFYNNTKSIELLLKDKKYYKTKSKKCLVLYNKFYSKKIFEKNLMSVLGSL